MCAYVHVFYDLILFFSWCFKFTLCKHVRLSYVFLINLLTYLAPATARPNLFDALATLHWLRVPERVQYKIAVLMFKVLHDSAPRYLGPLVAVADMPGRRTLRSASTSRLVAPPTENTLKSTKYSVFWIPSVLQPPD